MTDLPFALDHLDVDPTNIGEPTLQTVLDIINEAGCPVFWVRSTNVQVNGPNEIIVGRCGHVVDNKNWIDSHYLADNNRWVGPESGRYG